MPGSDWHGSLLGGRSPSIFFTPHLPFQARTKLSQRPWHVDNYDAFAAAWFSTSAASDVGDGDQGGAGELGCGKGLVWFLPGCIKVR